MDRALALFAIGLVFGGGVGFVIAAGAGVTLDGHDHAAQGAPADAATAGHDHGAPVSLASGAQAPSVRVTLTPDPVSGWNLHAPTSNFAFAPEKAGAAHVPGEGHAHVYVDGDKIARLYSPWMHLGALPEGATVEVTLNSNDHRPLEVDGKPVAASTAVPAR